MTRSSCAIWNVIFGLRRATSEIDIDLFESFKSLGFRQCIVNRTTIEIERSIQNRISITVNTRYNDIRFSDIRLIAIFSSRSL